MANGSIFLKKNILKQYPFHGCQFGVTEAVESGTQAGVHEQVEAYEAQSSRRASSPAASTGMPAEPKFPGKVKPPPPALMKWPGYASSRMLPPPPKGEAPKPPVPDVPKAVAKPAEPSAEEQPAKKKAALTSEPKPVAVASSAAVFLEPAPKRLLPKQPRRGR